MVMTIPALKWRPVKGDLSHQFARISDDEVIIVKYEPDEPEGYQWVVGVKHRVNGLVKLHGHPDQHTAKEAAHTHVGDTI